MNTGEGESWAKCSKSYGETGQLTPPTVSDAHFEDDFSSKLACLSPEGEVFPSQRWHSLQKGPLPYDRRCHSLPALQAPRDVTRLQWMPKTDTNRIV